MPVVKLFVRPEIRVQRLLIHGDPKDKSRVTGRTSKKFLDLHVKTVYDNGKKYRETITAHVYKKEIKVIIRATSRHDKDQSLTVDDFKKEAIRRWGFAMLRVLSPIVKFQKEVIK